MLKLINYKLIAYILKFIHVNGKIFTCYAITSLYYFIFCLYIVGTSKNNFLCTLLFLNFIHFQQKYVWFLWLKNLPNYFVQVMPILALSHSSWSCEGNLIYYTEIINRSRLFNFLFSNFIFYIF